MDDPDALERLVACAEERPTVRAVIVTSSRARPDGPVDALSDYDVILAVTDPERFATDDAWQHDLGPPMVRWGDESELFGLPTHFRGVVYEDGTKMDYTIWPREILRRIPEHDTFLDELDAGYRVLLDKDGATSDWPAPTYRAYVPGRPTEAEYLALVEEYWWDTTYVAKSLWRDELMFAKYILEHDIATEALRRMLEWRIELDHDWSLPTGVLGRGFKRLLPADIWAELEATYVGPGIEENWAALARATGLFRRVAKEVGDALGFAYPRDVDDRVTAYLDAVKNLPAPRHL